MKKVIAVLLLMFFVSVSFAEPYSECEVIYIGEKEEQIITVAEICFELQRQVEELKIEVKKLREIIEWGKSY